MKEAATARQVIRAAIAAAGGSPKIAEAFGMTAGGVNAWTQTGKVPAERIVSLCAMGGNVVKPAQILAAIDRDHAQRAAA